MFLYPVSLLRGQFNFELKWGNNEMLDARNITRYSIVLIFQSLLFAFELRGSFFQISFDAFVAVFAGEGLG